MVPNVWFLQAHKYSSTYVYDYPVLFGQVLDVAWDAVGAGASTTSTSSMAAKVYKADSGTSPRILQCKELTLNGNGELVHVDRPPCLNKVRAPLCH